MQFASGCCLGCSFFLTSMISKDFHKTPVMFGRENVILSRSNNSSRLQKTELLKRPSCLKFEGALSSKHLVCLGAQLGAQSKIGKMKITGS